jgi:hypothetical protein
MMGNIHKERETETVNESESESESEIGREKERGRETDLEAYRQTLLIWCQRRILDRTYWLHEMANGNRR